MTSNVASLARNLQQRKGRKQHRLVLAEGVRLVEEVLATGLAVRGAVTAPSLEKTPRGVALLANLASHAVPIESISDREFAKLADTDTPQGVLVVAEPPAWTLDDVVPGARAPVLVLDAVQDPGNVGTLIRTAFALGTAGALLLKGTADVVHPKVVRAAMGATFRLPIAPCDDTALEEWIEQHRVCLWVADVEGTPPGRLTPPERLALVMGNEGAGVRAPIRALAAERVAIPLARGAESLNVAVAAGILLHGVTRAF